MSKPTEQGMEEGQVEATSGSFRALVARAEEVFDLATNHVTSASLEKNWSEIVRTAKSKANSPSKYRGLFLVKR